MKQSRSLLKKIVVAAAAAAAAAYLYIDNNVAMSSYYRLQSDKLTAGTDYRITFVSDLHNKRFGKNNKKLADIIKKASPHAVIIGGDAVSGMRKDYLGGLKELVASLGGEYPLYFAQGNHERAYPFTAVKSDIESMGITFLYNNCIDVQDNELPITVYGLPDKAILNKNSISSAFDKINKNNCNILLMHRPDGFKHAAECGFDLVLSGHVHGGFIRLPFIGGLLSPNRTFLPKYDSGTYNIGNSTLVVSRGLGTADNYPLFNHLPLRINNPPELVFIDIYN